MPSAERLFAFEEVSDHRVEALARVVAGMRWQGRDGFESLTKTQQRVSRAVARTALETLAQEPE